MIQWHSVHLQGCATITSVQFQNIPSPRREAHPHEQPPPSLLQPWQRTLTLRVRTSRVEGATSGPDAAQGPLRTHQLLARSTGAGRVARPPGVLTPWPAAVEQLPGDHATVPTSVPRHRCRLVEILSGLRGCGGGAGTPHAVPAKGQRRPELWAAQGGPSQSRLLAGPVPGSGTRKGEG